MLSPTGIMAPPYATIYLIFIFLTQIFLETTQDSHEIDSATFKLITSKFSPLKILVKLRQNFETADPIQCVETFNPMFYFNSRQDLRYSSKLQLVNSGGDMQMLRRIYSQDRDTWNRNLRGDNIYNLADLGVGGSDGGICRCNDGQRYQVADNNDNCATLACINGTPLQCSPFTPQEEGEESPYKHKSMTCDPAILIPKAHTDLFNSYKFLELVYDSTKIEFCVNERNFHMPENDVPSGLLPIFTFEKYVTITAEQATVNTQRNYMIGIIENSMNLIVFTEIEAEEEFLLKPEIFNMNLRADQSDQVFVDRSRDLIFMVQKRRNVLFSFVISAFNYNDKVFGLQWTRKFWIDSDRATLKQGESRYTDKMYDKFTIHKILVNQDAG
jgi:hypothetical protein